MTKKLDDRTRHRPTNPARPVTLTTQVLSGVAAMLVTMGVLSITLPPDEVSTVGRTVLAASSAGAA